MYEAFFGLNEKPFNLTPDPRFLYRSPKHEEAFGHLTYAIENRTGFVMVSGEVGTGKTTICRSLINELDADTELAFIFNPMLSPKELLRAINEDFGIQSRGDTIKELIDELNEYLLERNADGKNCVLVIDEAQNLKPEVLEQVRLLSNLETETQKLLQIVLIGQPELAANLELPELRQLNQRITARYHLMPLSGKETLQYIAYRLRVAGGLGKVRFTRKAVRIIYRVSGGTPRMINAIADRALIVAYTQETREITKRIVRQAVREIHGKPVRKAAQTAAAARAGRGETEVSASPFEARTRPEPRRLPSPLLALLAVVVVVGIWYAAATSGWWPARGGVTLPAPVATAVTPSTPPSELTRADSTEVPEPPVEPVVLPSTRLMDPLGPVDLEAAFPSAPDTSFAGQLDRLDPEATRAAAAQAVLDAWGIEPVRGDPASDSWADMLDFAQAHGMKNTPMYPTLDHLGTINLPAFVRMTSGDNTVWLALVAIEDGEPRLTTTGGQTVLVSREEFDEHFTTESLVVWKDPAPEARTMGMPMAGRDISQLQADLRSLRWYAGPVSGRYDEATAEAVKKIQLETGLKVDGITGRNVRMVLSSWLSKIDTPSLRAIPPFNPDWPNSGPASSGSKQPPKSSAPKKVPPPEPPGESAPASAGSQPPGPEPPKLASSPAPQRPAGAEVAPADPDPGAAEPAPEAPEQPSPRPAPQHRVVAEELPPPKTDGPKEVTPPSVATLPLVPRERVKKSDGEQGES